MGVKVKVVVKFQFCLIKQEEEDTVKSRVDNQRTKQRDRNLGKGEPETNTHSQGYMGPHQT